MVLAGISGLLVIGVVMLRSVALTPDAGHTLPRVDVSHLANGASLVLDRTQDGFGKRLLVVRAMDGRLRVFAFDVRGGRVGLGEGSGQRVSFYCRDVGTDRGTASGAPGTIGCLDPEWRHTPSDPIHRWDLAGRSLSNPQDALPEVPFVVEDGELVVGMHR